MIVKVCDIFDNLISLGYESEWEGTDNANEVQLTKLRVTNISIHVG